VGLDWSTFLLELVNFLILVWILKRFLYAPVKRAITQRQQRVEAAMAEAEARRAEAQRMHQELEAGKQDLERERARAGAALEREMAAERSRRLEALEAEIRRRSEKAAILEERRVQDAERRTQEASLELAASFGAKLLSRIADRNLEARLVDLVLEDLPQLPEDQRRALSNNAPAEPQGVRVLSAYPLSDAQQQALREALSRAAGGDLQCEFDLEPGLVAGVEISAGPLVMRANLRDELRLFAEAAR
jgi:F-type H+-transporting ATPase subunit b